MGIQETSDGVRKITMTECKNKIESKKNKLIPDWLRTVSPFTHLDDEWVAILIFYVFHTPVEDISVRSVTLREYGWGRKKQKQ